MKNKMLSGAFWMSFGSIFSRVLGVLYIILWLAMFKTTQQQYTAQALYNAAYTPYGLFLALGTSGFPTAISRKIALYNSQNRYLDSKRLFKAGILFMSISGIVCGILFYLAAPMIASNSPVMSQGAATFVLRSLVPALMILPTMSIIRGWFQGHQDMKPFGVSQLIEQFIRVVGILTFTYVTFCVMNKSLTLAVALSTFAAFIGAIGSLVYLLKYYRRKKRLYRWQERHSLPATNIDVKGLFLEIVKEAVPFVYVGAGVTLNQLIDQFSFKQIMQWASNYGITEIQNMFTLFSANPGKITTIVTSLATAISDTTLPIIAGLIGNRKKISSTVGDNFKLLTVLLVPFVMTLAVLSIQVNTIFFGYNLKGSILMKYAILISLLLSLFLDITTLIQSLGKHRLAIILLSFGLIVKIVLQVPMIWLFHEYGALLATTVAFGIIVFLGFLYMCKYHYNYVDNLNEWRRIFIGVGLYTIGIIFIYKVVAFIPLSHGKISAVIFCMIFGVLAAIYYLMLAYIFKFKEIVFNMKK